MWDVITDKVIVRGEFEIKAIEWGVRLPDNPVHAVEIKHYKWTQDIDMPGARKGMDADASVIVEFVDYEVDECTRAYKYKYGDMNHHDDDDDDHDHDDCDDECDDDDHDDHDRGRGMEVTITIIITITNALVILTYPSFLKLQQR